MNKTIPSNIIINADDFGRCESVNSAIIFAFDKGIINRTTLMVNNLAEIAAVNEAKERGYLGSVGLHLNLDFGYPLTENIKNFSVFCDKDGRFNRGFANDIFCAKMYLSSSFKKSVEEEVSAQIARYLSLGCTLKHLDSHHHIHTKPFLLRIICPIANSYGILSMRIARNIGNLSLGKSIYKGFINKQIKRYFETTDYFGPFDDYKKIVNKKCSIELMIHPDFICNNYVDVISYKNSNYRNLDSLIL